MKRNLANTLDALVALAAICATPFVPAWAVWLCCFPALYLAGLALIKRNTNWIWQA